MPDEKIKTTGYPLLSFEYNKIPYQDILWMEPSLRLRDGFSIVTDDYEHDDFGHFSGDAEDALGHAAGILQQLEKYAPPSQKEKDPSTRTKRRPRRNGPDLYSLLFSLRHDFRNYCTCLKHGFGDKDALCALTEALLYYGCTSTVLSEVTEWNTELKKKKYSDVSESCLFDFDRLYIRQADRFLLLDQNVEEAMKFYELAALSWKIDSAGKPAKDFNDGYFVSFSRQYELYTRILKGAPYPYSVSSDSPTYFQLYNRIIDPEASAASRAKDLDAFLAAIKEILDTPNPRRLHRNRLALLMFIVITRKCLLPELARLYDDPEKKRWETAITEKSQLLKGSEHSFLSHHAVRIAMRSEHDYFYVYLGLAKAAYLSELILDELDAENDHNKIAYYTSAEVFSYMLPEKCTEEDDTADRLGKLTVMHLSYMNDPNEGKTLQKAIYGPRYGTLQKGRKKLAVPFVFVKCFSPCIDYLPMWEMYGDHARGCCLVIDWVGTKLSADETEPTLYRVCYLRKEGSDYIVSKDDNEKLTRPRCTEINSQLKDLRKVTQEITEGLAEEELPLLDEILGKLLYLFKDSSYSYEQELRVIYQTEENILHTKPKDPKDKPWLFVQTPFPLELDEVILGPKFPDVSTRVPYLQEQIYEMCDETDTTRPRITLSEIDYR